MRYLLERGKRWHYVRRVPQLAQKYDLRVTIRHSLNTDSLELAKRKRDDIELADNSYWSALAMDDDSEKATRLYEAAVFD